MTNKHMKRCLTVLVNRKMQIKIIMSYYYISIIMDNMNDNTKYERYDSAGTLIDCSEKIKW